MLVLLRKRGEQIVIGGNIIISVLSTQGNRVRLGVEAPANVTVYRDELRAALERKIEDLPQS